MLSQMINPLYDIASACKREVTYEHAQSVPFHTYIFVGEMVGRTDMQPVSQVRKVQAEPMQNHCKDSAIRLHARS